MSVRPALELPAELWEHIVSYLPETFTRNLYSVNGPLLHIALSLRYKVAHIDNRDTIEATLLNPNAQGRTRKVVISGNDTCYSSPNFQHALKSTLNRKRLGWRQWWFLKLRAFKTTLISWNRHGENKTPTSTDNYYEQVLNAVRALNHVQEVEHRSLFISDQHYWEKLQVTRALLGASFDHISKLTLGYPLEDIHRVLTPDIFLPRLSELQFSFRTVYTSSDPADSYPLVQGFLAKHFNTIETLGLNVAHMVNPSFFVDKLPKFPLLSSLLLRYHVLSLDHTRLAGLQRFIFQHRDQIRSMNLFILPHPFIHSQPYEAVFNTATAPTMLSFSNLNDLMLGMVPRSGPCARVKQYLVQYQSTLTSLLLHTDNWEYTNIQHLFSHLALNLQRLALPIRRLSPQLLSYLATTFPYLQHLVLNVVFWVTSNPDGHVNNNGNSDPPFSSAPSEFFDTLQHWDLPSITLIPLSPLLEIKAQDRASIVRALPLVRSVCEMDPKDYLAAKKDPGIAIRKQKDYWGCMGSF